MMNYKRITLFCIVVILTAGVSALAQTTPETELKDIYAKLDLALKARDADKLSAYYASGYTLESDGKTMKRAEAIDQWQQILGFIKTVDKLDTKVDKITLKDGLYLVDYSQASSGKIQFPGSPVLPFTYTGKITDVWQRSKDGKWTTLRSVEHASDLKVNGESAKPPNK